MPWDEDLRHVKLVQLKQSGDEHATVPLSAYYAANLLDAISAHDQNGDWWWEMRWWLGKAMEATGRTRIRSNAGTLWIWDPRRLEWDKEK
jgi:hypothetical protein